MTPKQRENNGYSLVYRYTRTDRCSVELSVRYDGQSQSESEHASLMDEHARLIVWQTGSICVLIWSSLWTTRLLAK